MNTAVANRDVLRTFARKVMSPSLYRRGADLLSHAQVVRHQGFDVWRTLHSLPENEGSVRTVSLRGLRHPVVFRPGTPDVGAIVQNLVRHEYGQIATPITPSLIIDGGSYIGDVALYFLNRYPHAQVISLEPDPANLQIARKNLAPYGARAELVHAGLWSHATTLHLSGEFTGARLDGDSRAGVAVDCVDLQSVLERSGHTGIDILKLDIEGAEAEVITEQSDGWLGRTRILIVEFHSRQIEERCLKHLLSRGFAGFRYRSLQYFFNTRLGVNPH